MGLYVSINLLCLGGLLVDVLFVWFELRCCYLVSLVLFWYLVIFADFLACLLSG